MVRGNQRGFTLIELVVVIVILGILAAFAVPRFANLETQARAAAIRGLEGSVRSASSLSHAVWLAAGNSPASVTMEGQTINMVNGYPALASVGNTLSSMSGFTYAPATGVFSLNGASNCTVTYAEATLNAGVVTPPQITVNATCQ